MKETVNRKAEAMDLVRKLEIIVQPQIKGTGWVALTQHPRGDAAVGLTMSEIAMFQGEAETPWEAVFDCAGRYYAHVGE